MIKFEKIKRFADVDLPLPTRGTAAAAGYDFVVAEDVIIPSVSDHAREICNHIFEKQNLDDFKFCTLDQMANLTKTTKAKPTLVSTGMKCYLDPGTYLELSVRSSTPLKYWLICANSVGIIDADYVDNPDNEGEIFFQLINLSPVAIKLKKGERIGQGIIKHYLTTDDDNATGNRLGGFGSTGK